MAVMKKKKPVKKKTPVKKKKTKRKAGNFGGYRIVPDAALAAVLGTKKPVAPSEMTKLLWKYIKKKKLAGKKE